MTTPAIVHIHRRLKLVLIGIVVLAGSWLKGQSTAVQDDALGPGRAALFRDGMSIDRFVKDGRTLTLDELQAL